MAVWKDLLDAFRPKAASNSETTIDLLREIRAAVAQNDSGIAVTVDKARQSATVATCVRLISESISHLPIVVYRADGDQAVPAKDHPVYSLLHDAPNEWQTSMEFRELLSDDLLYRGNAYAYKVPGLRFPQALIRLHPDLVAPEQDKATYEIRYKLTKPGGGQVMLDQSEVIHLRGYGDDGVIGLSPVQYHRQTIGAALAAEQTAARQFGNGILTNSVLEQDAAIEIKPEDRKLIRQDVQSLYGGSGRAFEVPFLPRGVTLKPIALTNQDAQFLETRKYQRAEIASIFRVPPHMIGDTERSTSWGTGIEQQSIGFVTYVLGPWLVRWEQALKRDLLASEPGMFIKINEKGLLRGDFKSRQEGLQIQRRNGVINANEWRGLEDYNRRTDPGGDAYIVEMNMRPDDGSDPDGDTANEEN